MKKTLALIAVGLLAVAALTFVSEAQNQPVASPVNRTDARFLTFPNVHHNAYTNGAGVTFTNATIKVPPGKAFTLSVTYTNAPGTGATTNHFDVSHDNGQTWTYAGLQTNGPIQVVATFTGVMRSNTVAFFTYVTNTHNYTDIRFTRSVPASVGTTNVYTGKALATLASP